MHVDNHRQPIASMVSTALIEPCKKIRHSARPLRPADARQRRGIDAQAHMIEAQLRHQRNVLRRRCSDQCAWLSNRPICANQLEALMPCFRCCARAKAVCNPAARSCAAAGTASATTIATKARRKCTPLPHQSNTCPPYHAGAAGRTAGQERCSAQLAIREGCWIRPCEPQSAIGEGCADKSGSRIGSRYLIPGKCSHWPEDEPASRFVAWS